jgi:hypothetical protein
MSLGHFDRPDMGVGEPEGAQQHRIQAPAAPSPTANSRTASSLRQWPPDPIHRPSCSIGARHALQLQEQLKALSPHHRDAFSRALRAALRVPDSTPSVAGMIRQVRHRIWIQKFLTKATRG